MPKKPNPGKGRKKVYRRSLSQGSFVMSGIWIAEIWNYSRAVKGVVYALSGGNAYRPSTGNVFNRSVQGTTFEIIGKPAHRPLEQGWNYTRLVQGIEYKLSGGTAKRSSSKNIYNRNIQGGAFEYSLDDARRSGTVGKDYKYKLEKGIFEIIGKPARRDSENLFQSANFTLIGGFATRIVEIHNPNKTQELATGTYGYSVNPARRIKI